MICHAACVCGRIRGRRDDGYDDDHDDGHEKVVIRCKSSYTGRRDDGYDSSDASPATQVEKS